MSSMLAESSTGNAAASSPNLAQDTSRATTSRAAKRSTAPSENWDDDFDFTSRASSPARPKDTRRSSKPVPLKRSGSFDSVVSLWDDSPPKPPAPIALLQSKSARLPAALSLSMSPPRHSPSSSSNLPSPVSYGSTPALSPPITSSVPVFDRRSSWARSDQSAGEPAAKNRYLKRNTSASFIAPSHKGQSTSSLSSSSYTNRSTPHLPHKPSREMMPPPALPFGVNRSKSLNKRHSSQTSKEEVRISGIPFSPSQEAMQAADGKKKGFWKRLSGSPSSEQLARPLHRRRRSSSFGSPLGERSSSPQPPMPPLPPGLRSTSSASTASEHSHYSTSSSVGGSKQGSTLSNMMRRSTSSLSKNSDASSSHLSPSIPYSPALDIEPSPTTSSSSLLPGVPNRLSALPTSPEHKRSFSRGFHLPSPSPVSPYNSPRMPGLPHSNSFPVPPRTRSEAGFTDTDTETEGEDAERRDKEATPRRSRIRPVSALPAPRNTSQGWTSEGWERPGMMDGLSNRPIAPRTASRSSIKQPPPSDIPPSRKSPTWPTSPKSPTFAQHTASKMKRLGSFSKKHGRRLSGGWKFGSSNSPTGDNNQESNSEMRRSSTVNKLETVVGSPSKPRQPLVQAPESPGASAADSPLPYTPRVEDGSDDEERGVRAGSASAPSSTFTSTRRHRPGTMMRQSTIDDVSTVTSPFATEVDGMPSSISENTALGTKKDSKRRMRECPDFEVPEHIWASQPGMRQNKENIERFARDVRPVQARVNAHLELLSKLEELDEETRWKVRALDTEYAEWWSHAELLVDIGATGSSAETQNTRPNLSHASPHRRSTSSNSIDDDVDAALRAMDEYKLGKSERLPANSQRSASLPDPVAEYGNASKSPGLGQQYASYGHNQGRALREMLSTFGTPLPSRPTAAPRSMSVLTVKSNEEYTPPVKAPSATMRHPPRPMAIRTPSVSSTYFAGDGGSRSGVEFPSPPDSNYVVTSESFPSPLTASSLAQPGVKKPQRRQMSRLVGFKDFLKSLKGQSIPPSQPSTPIEGSGRTVKLTKHRSKPSHLHLQTKIPPNRPGDTRTSLESPTAVLSQPTKNGGLPSHTARSSFSMMRGHTSPLPMAGQSMSGVNVPGHGNPGMGRIPSPEKRRPRVERAFKSSSGNWKDLGKASAEVLISPEPVNTASSSQRSTSDRSDSSLESQSLSGDPQKHAATSGLPRSSLKTPTTGVFSFKTFGMKSPKRQSLQVPIPSTPSPALASTVLAKEEVERTIRPKHSRIVGLGLPSSPSSPASPHRAGKSAPNGDLARAASSSSTPSPTKRRLTEYTLRSSSSQTHTSSQSGFESSAYTSSQSQRIISNETACTDLDEPVEVTPDNLPRLLDALKQVDQALQQWKERLDEILPSGPTPGSEQ